MTKSNTAQAPPPPRTPEPELRRLEAFVGEWNLEGRQLAGVVGPAADIKGVERYDWRLREQDGGWLLTGQWPMAGDTMQVRCTIRFTDGGRTRTGTWESSTDGSRWETFWDVRATRK